MKPAIRIRQHFTPVSGSCVTLSRSPCRVYTRDSGILSEAESNHEWVTALETQRSWQHPYDTNLHCTVSRCQQICKSASSRLGSFDQAVAEREVVDIRNQWSSSKGMPPDLLPRALFQAGSAGWDIVVWGLQRWAGPNNAAYRPSFRLTFVKAQVELMQEALVTQRWLSTGHCLTLLADIVKSDCVLVWYISQTVITSGVPEGGSIGPFGYPVLLDTFVREILANEDGLGIGWQIPEPWHGRSWTGAGCADPALTSMLKRLLASGEGSDLLPTSSVLDANPILEASALQAVNDLAP